MDNLDDQFSLKWNNFQSNLATGFHDLLQEEMMVDVTLAAEGKYLQAHKIILSVCSPYFKDLFKANACQHPIVILKDVGHQEMADMLDFMYRGEANVRQEDLAAFLKLAETLKVKGLAGDKDKEEDNPPSAPPPRKPTAQQVPKKKKLDSSVYDSEHDLDPGDSDYNPGGGGGGEPRRKKRRASPPKTESVMPSSSTSAQQNSFPLLANPKQEMPDPEEIQLIDDSEETNDPLVQLMQAGQGAKQEMQMHGHDTQDFDDSNFDSTLDETGDGSHEADFDMTGAGPSQTDDPNQTDQVPQETIKTKLLRITKTDYGVRKLRHDGATFTFMKQTKIWKCAYRYAKKCKVIGRINNNEFVTSGVHSHPVYILQEKLKKMKRRGGRRNTRKKLGTKCPTIDENKKPQDEISKITEKVGVVKERNGRAVEQKVETSKVVDVEVKNRPEEVKLLDFEITPQKRDRPKKIPNNNDPTLKIGNKTTSNEQQYHPEDQSRRNKHNHKQTLNRNDLKQKRLEIRRKKLDIIKTERQEMTTEAEDSCSFVISNEQHISISQYETNIDKEKDNVLILPRDINYLKAVIHNNELSQSGTEITSVIKENGSLGQKEYNITKKQTAEGQEQCDQSQDLQEKGLDNSKFTKTHSTLYKSNSKTENAAETAFKYNQRPSSEPTTSTVQQFDVDLEENNFIDALACKWMKEAVDVQQEEEDDEVMLLTTEECIAADQELLNKKFF